MENKEINYGYRTNMINIDEFNRAVTELSKTSNVCAISAEELAKALNFQKERQERVLIGYRCKCAFCGKKYLVEPSHVRVRAYDKTNVVSCPHCGYDIKLDSKRVKEIWKK